MHKKLTSRLFRNSLGFILFGFSIAIVMSFGKYETLEDKSKSGEIVSYFKQYQP